MPNPQRENPDDYFEQLDEHQRDHMQRLREISLSYAPEVHEVLHWNQPAYLRGKERMWMLQAYGKHCSLRFAPAFYGAYVDEATAEGYESGAGFLKILYSQEVPEALCRRLIEASLGESSDKE